MTQKDFTLTFSVEKTPEEVFDAINDVRSWWSGEITGESAKLGAEFSYRYKDVHFSKQKLSEFVRGKKIVWHVVEAELSFVEDTGEWTGTDIVFEITKKGSATEVRFTHVGLHPEEQCYADCSSAWSTLLGANLRRRIVTGTPQADPFSN